MRLFDRISQFFKRPEQGGSVYWHWTNETEADKEGTFPFHGRLWVHLGERHTLRFSWNLKSDFVHAKVSTDRSESDITFSIGFVPVSVWFGFESWSILNKLIEAIGGDRELSVSYHDHGLWWNLWTDPNTWKSTTPFWRHGSIDFADMLLGKAVHSEVNIGEPVSVIVSLLEGAYVGECQMRVSKWERPRWFDKVVSTAEIKMESPIPIPGKGENGWDCDEDAIYKHSGPAYTPGEAVASLTESVIRTREKRGGLNWKPAPPQPSTVVA